MISETREVRKQLLDSYLAERTNVRKRNALVAAHLWIASSLASKASRFSPADYGDLHNEAAVGIMHAAEKFDPAFSVMFSTYATFWARERICKYMARSRAFNTAQSVNKATKEFTASRKRDSNGELTPFALSLDKAVGEDMDMPLHECIGDSRPSQEEGVLNRNMLDHVREVAKQVIAESKDPRNKLIFDQRIMADEPATLLLLSEQMNVSKQRVEQKEKQLLRKMRERLDGFRSNQQEST